MCVINDLVTVGLIKGVTVDVEMRLVHPVLQFINRVCVVWESLDFDLETWSDNERILATSGC